MYRGGRMVQIDFLDSDVISNLVPVFTMQPNVLCILYDGRRFRRKDLERFKEAVLRRDRFVEIREYTCDQNDIENITHTLQKVIDEYGEDDIYADVTGGPELMTAAACMLGKEGKLNPIYLDLANELVFCVFDRNVRFRAKKITMEDYVTVKGAKHFSDSRSKPDPGEFEMICGMAELLFDSLEEWKLLQKYLSTYFYGYTGMHFSVKNLHCSKERMRGIEKLLEGFEKKGFIFRRDDGKYVIRNTKYKEYITNYGIWLEMYVYIKALECFDEVHLGYIIDWNSGDGMDTDDNEFDVVLMNKNHPVFISCKMTKPTSKDLTEIGYLSKRLGGESALGILATTYSVSKNNESGTSLYRRMKKLEIGLIEADGFRKKSSGEVFREAMDFVHG